jgi:hypothetical protein
VRAGWYPDPANPDVARYWNSAARAWGGKQRKDVTAAEVPTDPPEPSYAQKLARDAIAAVSDCIVLGGYGTSLNPGAELALRFVESALELWAADDRISVPYDEVTLFEITSESPDAAVAPLRFRALNYGGVIGAMEVKRLDTLIARFREVTVIQLQTDEMELFVSCPHEPALAIRIRLSEALGAIRAGQRAAPLREPEPT